MSPHDCDRMAGRKMWIQPSPDQHPVELCLGERRGLRPALTQYAIGRPRHIYQLPDAQQLTLDCATHDRLIGSSLVATASL